MCPRLRGRFSNEVLGGGLAALVGLAIVSVGLFDSRNDAFPAGRVPVFLAGAAFLLAGSSILLQALWRGPRGFRVASALGALCGLALIATPASLVGGEALWKLGWILALALSLVGAVALALSGARSPAPSKRRARLLAAAFLLLLAVAAGARLLRDPTVASPPGGSGERPMAEQEPPEAGP